MQKHVTNYMKHHGFDTGSFIPCQVCEKKSNEIHHVKYRSAFGKKRKDEQDDPKNLIALCRSCHNDAHDNKLTKDYLFDIIKKSVKLVMFYGLINSSLWLQWSSYHCS